MKLKVGVRALVICYFKGYGYKRDIRSVTEQARVAGSVVEFTLNVRYQTGTPPVPRSRIHDIVK